MAKSRTMVRVIVLARDIGIAYSTSNEYVYRTQVSKNGGAVMALYGSKAVAAGVSAAMSAALGFLTMPFKGTGINALKVGK